MQRPKPQVTYSCQTDADGNPINSDGDGMWILFFLGIFFGFIGGSLFMLWALQQ